MNKLKLVKELYDKNSISKAIKDYEDLCVIQVKDLTEVWELIFFKCVYDTKLTMKEFENYVIDIINVRGK